MTSEQHARIEGVLRYILIGQQFCRVHFYSGTPILYVWGPKPPGAGWWYDNEANIVLWLQRWQLFDSTSCHWPEVAGDLPEHPIEELVSVACQLRNNAIVGVELGREAPHLLLNFDDGRVLILNGHHDEFESWEINAGEDKAGPGQPSLKIISVPGDNIAMWLPADFRLT